MPVRRLAVLVVSLGLAVTGFPAGAAPAPGPRAAPAAKAAPSVNGVYPLTAQPEQLVAGPDGNMWVTLSGSGTGDDLAKVAPNGAITYYDVVPGALGALTVAGPHLWSVTGNGLVKIATADPENPTVTPNANISDPRGIALGPDRMLWAASGDKVVRWSPGDPAGASAFTVAGMAAREVAATGNRVWVVDNGGGRLLAFRPDASGTFITKGIGGTPQGLGVGTAGQVIYTNPGTNPQTIGIVTPTSNPRIIETPMADPSFSVGFGADGAYWVGLFNEQKMLRVTPRGKITRLFSFAAPYRPRHVARGPGGTIWVSLQDPGMDGAIARIAGVRDLGVTVTLVRRKARIVMGGAGVRLACPSTEASGPCRGRVVLRATTRGKRVLGQVAWSAPAGATTTANVSLKKRVIRSVGRRGVGVRAVITVRDGAGNASTVRRAVRLVR